MKEKDSNCIITVLMCWQYKTQPSRSPRSRSLITIPIQCMSHALQLMLPAAVGWIDVPIPSVPVEMMASRDSLSALSDLFQSARLV